MQVYDDSMSVDRGFGRLESRYGKWTDGVVITPHGIVWAYAQGDKESFHHTRLDFVHNGRLYMRNFRNRRYSQRGIVTKAKEFAKEIMESEAGDE